MRRPRTGLARLLALLLLAQWAAATAPHAQALARLGGAIRVELCSAHGARSLLLDRDGQPIRAEAASDCCTLCLGPAAPPPPADATPPRAWGHAVLAHVIGRPGWPPFPSRATPQLPRAPPLG